MREEEEKKDEEESDKLEAEVAAAAEGEGESDPDMEDGVEVNPEEEDNDGDSSKKRKKKKKKNLGPLFDPKAQYNWQLCAGRNKQNYVPCVDLEAGSGGGGSHRHHERSCPRHPVTCLVPLPQGYENPVRWPDSQLKVAPFRSVWVPVSMCLEVVI